LASKHSQSRIVSNETRRPRYRSRVVSPTFHPDSYLPRWKWPTSSLLTTLILLRADLPPRVMQRKYQELNRKFFDNSLPPVRIEWADLTEYNRLGETYRENDGMFVVLVDLRTNFRDEDLQDTVFHEMCHVATWRRQDDPRGSAFPGMHGWDQGKGTARRQYEGTMSGSCRAASRLAAKIYSSYCTCRPVLCRAH
jgi:hypothetical protein